MSDQRNSPQQVSLFDCHWKPQKGRALPWEIRQKMSKPKGGRNKKGSDDNFHNIDYDFVSPTGEVFTGTGVRKFAQKHELNESCLRDVLKGRVHSYKGWTKAVGGRKLPELPIYYFLSPFGEIYNTNNLSEFARQHGLCNIALSRLSRCIIGIHRGWKHCTPDGQPIVPSDRKHRKFTLVSPSGEVIEGTNLKAFAEKHGLSRTCLINVLANTSVHHQGWKLPKATTKHSQPERDLEIKLPNDSLEQVTLCQYSIKVSDRFERKPGIKERNKESPVLPSDAPTSVILFAGGGGIEAGMVEAGIRPLVSVECDPQAPKLSNAIADCHERNFGEYGSIVLRQTVQELSELGFPRVPRNPDFLHASPVCSNFSNALAAHAIETEVDIAASRAIANAIALLQPKNFTLENVPRYQKSTSFEVIINSLQLEGYQVASEVVNMADYGLPQSRRRLILRASIQAPIPLPQKSHSLGWYDAIAHLIPSMADSKLLPGQGEALSEFLAVYSPTPLLIERVGGRGGYKYKPGDKPSNTLTRSQFTDGKGANRNKFADIWLPDGTVKSVSIAAAAILQGFPDWYILPSDIATAGSIIGYSVPPSFAKLLFTEPPLNNFEDLLVYRQLICAGVAEAQAITLIEAMIR